MTKEQFKTEVCNRAPSFVDCNGKLRVNVQNFSNFSGAATGACLDGGNLITDGNSKFEPGSAEAVVLVTVCYEWDLAKSFPFINLGDMGSGSRLIQASAVFRTEPYSN